MQFGSVSLGGRTVRISGRAVEHVRRTDPVTLPHMMMSDENNRETAGAVAERLTAG